jgi:hypothetical protein
LIVAVFIIILFGGAAALREVCPGNWWVQAFLAGERFTVWLIGWGVVLYAAEHWLVRSRWYVESWLMKELGGRPTSDEGKGSRRLE